MLNSKNVMGAIVGDIVGSKYEFNNHRSKDFELFSDGCFATDDSIMTIAVMRALMDADGDDGKLSAATVSAMREIGQMYPGCGFGGRFFDWMFSPNPKPYGSYGNGAAMRVSPVAYVSSSLEEVKRKSRLVTEVTHGHPEGIKGAEATAAAAWMALFGADKSEIIDVIERDYYPLDFTIDEIREDYTFSETCQKTVPQAMECFRESTGFEDAVRLAVSLGGDSDTLAAIAGAVAGAYYGVPDDIANAAMGYLDDMLLTIVRKFIKKG